MSMSLTQSAAQKINEIIAGSDQPAIAMRLEVLGGGCSGYKYKFDLAPALEAEDVVIELEGAKLVVDKTSLEHLAGSELDYIKTLTSEGFRLTNPNAESSCGCGNSFSKKQ